MPILNGRYAIVPNEEPRPGGMAEVYRAIDLKTTQHVAIKFFHTEIRSNPIHLEAYSRECSALQRLDHPNIVSILDVGKDSESGRRFLVLEWLETTLLQHVADQRPLGWDTFYEKIGRPILDALVYAYSKDVLHRDLKPQNVLFSPERVLKVADFGISKLRSYVSLGRTMRDFRSEPYAPPERDDGTNSESRDVFGFAVLVLECLNDVAPVSYDDVYNGMMILDVPSEIADILSLAVSKNPDDRHTNIVILKEALESIQAPREAGFGVTSRRRRCYVRIASRVESKLNEKLGDGRVDVKSFVIEDLNENCGIKGYQPSKAENGPSSVDGLRFSLYAAQYLYYGVIDQSSKGYLVVHEVREWQPSSLEFQRDSAWIPDVEFRLQVGASCPSDGVETMAWLVASVADHEDSLSEQRQAARTDDVFRRWTSILYAKSDVEQRQETPIPYRGFEKAGSRLKLFTDYAVEDHVIGQPRLIEVSEQVNRVVAGEVDAIGDDFVVLWVEDDMPAQVPSSGTLQFDTRASRQAIHRQRQAVDAVRFGRCARPGLRDLLVDPETAPEPAVPGGMEVAADRLDDSQQKAVKRALGTDSLLVVEGPPGTGKTRFIKELVIQTLKRTPEARILLTSQTHVALDNALEQIQSASTSLKLVRIGHRNDDRVSPEVANLLLENRVDTWLTSVRSNSERFLAEHANELGVDRTEIDLGMAAARLRAALDHLQVLDRERRAATSEVTTLVRKGEKAAVNRADTYQEVNEALQESSDTAKRLEAEIKRARRRVNDARAELATLPNGPALAELTADEIREWEEAFLNTNDSQRKMHRLVALAGEWYLRFGRSRDFFAALIADSEVIAGTCLGFAGVRGIQNVDFDLCIVDEASKATATELLVPLSRSHKWILVGDRKQLPPFVDAALRDASFLNSYNLTKEDLEATLLDVLADRLPPSCVTGLVHQHRMIKPIGDLVSQCFYDGQLKSSDEGNRQRLAPVLPRPVTWFSTDALDDRHELRDDGSYKNLAEVKWVYSLLRRLNFSARLQEKYYEVAVLTGYAAQKIELRRALNQEQQELECLSIVCNTVDAFQGRETDITIYSVTRSNDRGDLGFLQEQRRLNVALSRARIGLGIVGDASYLRSASGYNPWRKVLDYIASHPDDCAFEELS